MSKAGEPKKTVRTKDRIEFHLLAEKIAKLRDEKGMSQRGLSAALGRDSSFINSVEMVEVYPDFATLLDIFEALERDPIEVFKEVICEANIAKSAQH